MSLHILIFNVARTLRWFDINTASTHDFKKGDILLAYPVVDWGDGSKNCFGIQKSVRGSLKGYLDEFEISLGGGEGVTIIECDEVMLKLENELESLESKLRGRLRNRRTINPDLLRKYNLKLRAWERNLSIAARK